VAFMPERGSDRKLWMAWFETYFEGFFSVWKGCAVGGSDDFVGPPDGMEGILSGIDLDLEVDFRSRSSLERR